jgi:peptidoglycan/xylan/chitin deacetylase (PgdA/CDA1 family)
MLLSVNYHYIRESFEAPYPAIFGKTPGQFEKQILELSKYGSFISADQLDDSIKLGKSLPRKAILITFDDGLKEQLQYAVPILNRMGVPACFFINTKTLTDTSLLNVHLIHLVRSQLAPEIILEELMKHPSYINLTEAEKAKHRNLGIAHYRYDEPENAYLKYILNFALSSEDVMAIFQYLFDTLLACDMKKVHGDLYLNENDLKTLGRSQFIGSHSHDHLPLGVLEEGFAKEEVARSRSLLERAGHPPKGFSYPYGSKEAVGLVHEWLDAYDFSFAVTMNRGYNVSLDKPFLLNRCDNNDVPGGKSYQPALLNGFLA